MSWEELTGTFHRAETDIGKNDIRFGNDIFKILFSFGDTVDKYTNLIEI
jgi:hypothetical protein